MEERSAHEDTFVRDNLPPLEDWPVLDFSGAPELEYPARLNAAVLLLDRAAALWGDRPALHFQGRTYSYREVGALTDRIAHALVDVWRCVPGQRVHLRAFNGPLAVAAWFAVLKVGAIAVSTMPMLRARELAYVITKARAHLTLCDDRLAPDMIEAARAASGHCVVTLEELERVASKQPDRFDAVDTAATDVAMVAFTSGTTGAAKGSVHFHRDVVAVSDLFPKHALRPTPNDVFFGSPPLAFTFGLGALVLFPFRVGASALLIEKPSPERMVQAMKEEGGTILFTAPTMYRALLEPVASAGTTSLKKCVSAGETLPLATFEAWQRTTGIRIIDGLGSTEMLHIFVTAEGDAIRPGSTGRALAGYRVRVVDDDGNDAPAGAVGKLAVRGPTGCRYLDDLERQRAYVKRGWNLTGDAYRRDEDGYFWFVARADDMIISAGYNISGPEVEAVLLEHPKVKECAVVGAPDVDRGFIVHAFVVLRDPREASAATVSELQAHAKALIAPYKYPRAIEFVDTLPKTENGKIQRYRLRESVAPPRGGVGP